MKQPDAVVWEIAFLRRKACERFKVSEFDIASERRDRHTMIARHIAMLLAHSMTTASFSQIGRAFGGRDHSTVMNGVERARDMIGGDPGIAAAYHEICLDFAESKRAGNGQA